MNEALIVYSGISVKMLVDRRFGADLLTMFTVDYEPGGSAQQHDHPFEEAYFFLAGDVEAELDGTVYQVHPGDVVFSAVGGVHGFYNNGTEQVRWIETQAPQPPARHAVPLAPDVDEVRGGERCRVTAPSSSSAARAGSERSWLAPTRRPVARRS
jgi:quercetin dioxygenase-like cupin family protein